MGSKVEQEVALLVTSDKPDVTLSVIGALSHLGSFQLVKRPTQWISDTYFDSPGGTLKSRGYSIRIRNVSSEGATTTFVTLKGKNLSNLISSREENEVEWTFSVDPELIFNAFGLERVQERVTTRMIRDVYDKKDLVAELGADKVVYLFGNDNPTFYEIEIELKDKGISKDLDKITEKLLNKFPDDLRRWKHSKLTTGKIFEFATAFKQNGDLVTAETFDSIEKLMETV